MIPVLAPEKTESEVLKEEFAKRVEEEVRRLAELQPDKKAACWNGRVTKGVFYPECIVGTAFYNLGVSPEILVERSTANGVLSELFGDLCGNGPHPTDPSFWLHDVQYRQDTGATWSEAVTKTDSFVEDFAK